MWQDTDQRADTGQMEGQSYDTDKMQQNKTTKRRKHLLFFVNGSQILFYHYLSK